MKHPLTKARLRRNGFTLFELMLVMAIIIIVGAIASPLLFQSMYEDAKVMAAADMVRARWADCRTHAIDEGRPYCFWVIPNTGKFKIEPYNPDTQSNTPGDPMAASGSADSPDGYCIEDRLPAGIRFGTADTPVNIDGDEPDGGTYVPVAIFQFDGTAQDDVEITFGGKGTGTIKLQLRALTGTATTIRPSAEDGR
jgi:prepilin-type N-terminal cleavage/methylation domain-containing protein